MTAIPRAQLTALTRVTSITATSGIHMVILRPATARLMMTSGPAHAGISLTQKVGILLYRANYKAQACVCCGVPGATGGCKLVKSYEL